jgi:carboxymethylenebutenolidase
MMLKSRFLLGACLTLSAAFAQDWARQQLEKSPRHQEWVQVKAGAASVHAFVVYPEVKHKATSVVVIHENQGLTDWVRTVADELAAHGYIAIAPDMLSGKAPNRGKTSDFPTADAAREAIYKLQPEEITAALHAVTDYVRTLPAANGKVAVAGFCWGGSQTFRFATVRSGLAAAFVFYGSGPDDVSAVTALVYGFYGGADARVNATIPKSEELMKAAGKKYEPVIYEGAGHGFMRSGQDPAGSEVNRKARSAAWKRWLALLAKL